MAPMLVLDSSISSIGDAGPLPPMPCQIPERGALVAGTYRILRLLGTGAMGVVLLAHDEVLDREVALKLIGERQFSASTRRQFLTEARSLARISHRNVVRIHAFGEHGGAPYFVMEYVPGPTLEEWIAGRDAPIEVDLALRILDELCCGVAAIHAANTVHHDIKPSNVLLDGNLRPRITDLGLAALYGQDSEPFARGMVGTPEYMAPEVAFSRAVPAVLRTRADVYSLGCVAYQLLTGQPPFDATTALGLMMRHAMQSPTPPSDLRPGLPAPLDEAVLRALTKDPEQRTPSAQVLRDDLARARGKEREPARILVVEDDADFRQALQLFLALEFPGAEIECVEDGLSALRAVDRNIPSIAIVDLRMPEMDGVELTRRLRERESFAAVPIVVVTACGGAEEWSRLAAMGANRFLVKPIVLDDLVSVIRRVLGAPTRADSALAEMRRATG